MLRRGLFVLPLVAACGLQLAAARRPDLVEALYSKRVYPLVAATLTAVTSPMPFALADVLAGLALVGLAWLLVPALRGLRTQRRAALRLVRITIALAGLGYLAFLLLWALNYRRQPLAGTLGLDATPAPIQELAALAEELTEGSNGLRQGRAESAGVLRLEAGIPEALRRAELGYAGLGAVAPVRAAARPKGTWLSLLLSHLGISGIFIPFTGEPLVNALIPEPELPFSACHELAHRQGWAREDEASFVAFLACRAHPDPDFRYSGALVASLHALAALAARDAGSARRIAAGRSAEVERDVAFIRAWRLRYEGALSRAGDRVNDRYLRSQGDARGLESYGRMVDLLLAERRARRTPGATMAP